MSIDSKAVGFNSFAQTVKLMLPPDAYARFLEAVPPETRQLVEQPPIATSWIDDAHFTVLFVALDQTVARGNLVFFTEVGRKQMHRDMTTIYRLLLHLATPQMVIRKAAQVYSTYTKNGTMHATASGPRECIVAVRDVTDTLPQMWAYHSGTIGGVLECSGVKSPHVTIIGGGGYENFAEYRVTW